MIDERPVEARTEQPKDLERAVLESLRTLPRDKQQEVLDFVEFLQRKSAAKAKPPRRSLYGLWADLGVQITAEDIAEARREMWAGDRQT